MVFFIYCSAFKPNVYYHKPHHAFLKVPLLLAIIGRLATINVAGLSRVLLLRININSSAMVSYPRYTMAPYGYINTSSSFLLKYSVPNDVTLIVGTFQLINICALIQGHVHCRTIFRYDTLHSIASYGYTKTGSSPLLKCSYLVTYHLDQRILLIPHCIAGYFN